MSMQNSLWDFLGTPDLDHGEKYPEEPCVHTLTRQEFFTSGAEGVYLFIKYCRSSFDDDGKIMAKKFAYFPVIATEDSNGYIDALWAWPVDSRVRKKAFVHKNQGTSYVLRCYHLQCFYSKRNGFPKTLAFSIR